MINKIMTITVLVISTLFLSNCSKEISITKFKDDYQDYETEKRIEAVFNASDIAESIVRIDNTMLVTNTDFFDEQDNDGDWKSYEDVNNNGKWDKGEPLNDDIGAGMEEKGKGNGIPDPGEPHVDEIDEVIPHLHDSTWSVSLYNKTDNILIADFKWQKEADDFEYEANGETEEMERITYGGYVPDNIYVSQFDFSKNYEFVIENESNIITGDFEVQKPVDFLLDQHEMNRDTVMINHKTNDHIFWHSEFSATVYWVIVERIIAPDSTIIIESNPFSAIARADDGGWLCMEFSSEHAPGLYQLTVYVPSRDYGHYFFSGLPIRDEQLNNLRDQNDEVVLGIAGSISANHTYFRVRE